MGGIILVVVKCALVLVSRCHHTHSVTLPWLRFLSVYAGARQRKVCIPSVAGLVLIHLVGTQLSGGLVSWPVVHGFLGFIEVFLHILNLVGLPQLLVLLGHAGSIEVITNSPHLVQGVVQGLLYACLFRIRLFIIDALAYISDQFLFPVVLVKLQRPVAGGLNVLFNVRHGLLDTIAIHTVVARLRAGVMLQLVILRSPVIG